MSWLGFKSWQVSYLCPRAGITCMGHYTYVYIDANQVVFNYYKGSSPLPASLRQVQGSGALRDPNLLLPLFGESSSD